MTAPLTPDPINAPPTHEEHASTLHTALSVLEGLMHLVENPAIVQLLPPKYQQYALAVAAVDGAIHTSPAAN